MSWMKRRNTPSSNPSNPEIRMYNPSQHSNTQSYQQWQQPPVQQYDPNNWYNQQKSAPAKSPPTQGYNQQTTQNYWQQPYPQQNYTSPPPSMMPNQYEQYNQQNYYPPNQGYPDTNTYNQGYMQQNYYPPQNMQPNANAPKGESEQDPWNWGWEDNNSNPPQQNTKPETFTNDESWNWSVEDNQPSQTQEPKPDAQVKNHNFQPEENFNREEQPLQHAAVKRLAKNENLTPQWSIESQVSQDSSDDIVLTSESDNRSNILSRSSTISHSPSRPESTHDNEYSHPYRYDNDAKTENEQTANRVVYNEAQNSELYKDNVVENINKTMQDLSLFENKEIVAPEIGKQDNESTPPLRNNQMGGASNYMGPPINQMAPPTNKMTPPPNQMNPTPPSSVSQTNMMMPPPHPISPAPNQMIPPPQKIMTPSPSNMTPIPSASNQMLPPPSQMHTVPSSTNQIAPPTNTQMMPPPNSVTPPMNQMLPPPPTNQIKEDIKQPIKEPTPPPPRNMPVMPPPGPSNDGNKNPYKRNTGLSHRDANKLRPKDSTDANVQNMYMPQNLVNLETLPDNSERPDQLPVENIQKTVRKTSIQQQWMGENCEIAPINDRNQYLETGQLSESEPVYNQSENQLDAGDSLPPPGLRRLVLGQIEQSETNQNIDNADEPPPGLSRMVLGQTETVSNTIPANAEPPVGLHRMVPGESSSPESSSYARYQNESNYQTSHFDDDNYASEAELNQLGISGVSQRSATIGADTPPATNQQNVSNVGYSSSSSGEQISNVGYPANFSGEPIISRVGAVGIDSEHRDTDLDGANTLDESLPSVSSIPPENNRRDNIDGGSQDDIITVRNQTVGQNPTDSTQQQPTDKTHKKYPTNQTTDKPRKTNRSYTTDSEHEKDKHRSNSPRYEDRRYYEERRDRESPDRYRKYERRRHEDKRYDDDTDYYSDKERERRRRDDRDERYSSLRREKDRDKRRRDYRDDRERRSEYYYRYDDDYYRDANRSRPSSRSDSVHDSFRERSHRHERELDRSVRQRDRDREKDHRRSRADPYNNYYQGYHQSYDPYNPYYHYQQYQYYENLRRTNPQAYSEWYRKYYQSQSQGGYNAEDRASVHSGRSSANGDNKDRYTRQSYYSQQSYPNYYRDIPNASTVYTVDDSRIMDQTDSSLNLEDTAIASQRLTPAKFSTAHVKASIQSGFLLNILPHYPVDGQPAIVEVLNIHDLLEDDEETRELTEFPGPLIKGVTHKKTVIDYCEMKIRKANANIVDVESYILMWELLILLLRQNGMVVGTDIAELLMKNRKLEENRSNSRSSINSQASVEPSDVNRASPAIYKDDYITEKFREYLIYGSGKEALEWAMKHGLWGHALFLASKLDKRTYANVMMRFANGLTMNDPLQTLYQLLSGRQPAAVTCVADEKWGDWRPHLAMILSNTTQRPELDRKAITTLGDTLYARGSIYAAHFCYLMAQVEFGRYGVPNTKLVLLGSSHNKPFEMFASNEAIFMTEVYEYACSLSDTSFAIPEFLTYKYLLATRIVDHGLLEKGLQYLERTADGIAQNPVRVQVNLVASVCALSDRLKYCDPLQAEDLDSNRADTTWLTNLKSILNDFNMGLISNQTLHNPPEADLQDIKPITDQSLQWQPTMEYYQQTDQPSMEYQQPISYQEPLQDIPNQKMESETVNQENQSYWGQQQWEQQEPVIEEQQSYWNQPEKAEVEPETPPTTDDVQPQITMPNQSQPLYENLEENQDVQQPVSSAPKPVSSTTKPKTSPIAQNKQASTGWFGGIWNKLSLRPKNQMKLPDDKNPTIVWDSEKKRWVDLEAENDEGASELKPPPKMSEMSFRAPPAQPASLPPAISPPLNSGSMSLPPMPSEPPMPTPNPMNNMQPLVAEKENQMPKAGAQNNMFKLRRGRNIKNAYVDVFNPGGVKPSTENVPSAEEVFGAIPSVNAQMNYFVPTPIVDPNAPTDFLSSAPSAEDNSQLSRWSSASSLSREVQSYTLNAQRYQVPGGPKMYNPNEYSKRNH